MPRIHSARSDVSDGDVDGMAEKEQEFAKLQRQYRIMENDRKAYCQESQDLIKKQKSEIEKLDMEKEEMCKDLRLIEGQGNSKRDEKNIEDLGELGREKQTVEEQIDEEKKKQEELKAKCRDSDKNNREHSKSMGGANMSAAHNTKTQKNIRKMENQLQMANNNFCKGLEENRKLRKEIDSLRTERQRFENLFKKLDKELQELKREMGEVIDQSTQAYDQRDEAQAKMILLKEKSDKDVQQHNAEMKELVRVIDHDRKLRDFMNTKSKERQEDPQLVAWRQQKEAREAEKKKASQQDSVESYEAAFQRIKTITGEEDLDLLVKHFIEVEDRNFALFNYVNEQNSRIEVLKEKIQEIKDEMAQFQSQGVEMESQRKGILRDLENRQEDSSGVANEYDTRHTAVSKILDQLKAGVESLFNKINCDRASIDDMLGAQEGVTQGNMLQYLGIIEERTNQLLLMQAYIKQNTDQDDYTRSKPGLLGEGPQPQGHTLPIMAPSVGDEYDDEGSDDNDDDRPMTRNELISKAMKSCKKRESAMRKEGFRYDLSDAREKAKKKDKKGGRH